MTSAQIRIHSSTLDRFGDRQAKSRSVNMYSHAQSLSDRTGNAWKVHTASLSCSTVYMPLYVQGISLHADWLSY